MGKFSTGDVAMWHGRKVLILGTTGYPPRLADIRWTISGVPGSRNEVSQSKRGVPISELEPLTKNPFRGRRNPEKGWYASFSEDGRRWYAGPMLSEEAHDLAALYTTMGKSRTNFSSAKPAGGHGLTYYPPPDDVRRRLRAGGWPVPSESGGYSHLSSYRKAKKKNPRRNPLSSDDKVIAAFLDQKSGESKKLTSTGSSLDGNWTGGRALAVWTGDKVRLGDPAGAISQSWIKKVAKAAPANWLTRDSRWALPRSTVARLEKAGR